MLRSALGHLSDINITKPDAQAGRHYLRALTAKIQELQQLIFKARTRILHERTRGHQSARTRQLQLPRMTHPAPNSLSTKRSRPTTFTVFTSTHVPWLKKTKHHSTPEHSNTSHRITPPSRPRLRSTPAFPLDTTMPHTHPIRTPQPPLLTTPHWTTLWKRHRPAPLLPNAPHLLLH